MKGNASWMALCLILILLLGGCAAMAGDFSPWPACSLAVIAIVAGKIANDRWKIVKWPMEFLFWSAMTMIIVNLIYLYATS
jgi:uncharacterized membrane protein YphA (DoxX/SURF4 family)